jgi:N-ethylmaleimide reductase
MPPKAGSFSSSFTAAGSPIPTSMAARAPSPVRPAGLVFTPGGMKDFVVPRQLRTEEIPEIIEQFARGAENAMSAGFDGVELHCANGYLPDQFLCDGTNHREDRYGGSIENRARFVIELVERVTRAVDPGRVGIRMSPSGLFNDMYNSRPRETFEYVIDQINRFNLCYLHLMEPREPVDSFPQYLKTVTAHFRKIHKGAVITNCGFDRERGNLAIRQGTADLVAYGRLFLANPDLPERFEKTAPLNKWEEATFYGGNEKGYTDYPFME